MTTRELHIGHAYVIRDDRKGLCIALAASPSAGQVGGKRLCDGCNVRGNWEHRCQKRNG